jgi:NAD(P)-dependent dehydrogenase (short-subunit alcohol dehydrogenase family)
MGRLEGKAAIVTGAGRVGDTGVAVCEAFLRDGAKAIIGTDLRVGQAGAIQARISKAAWRSRIG